MKLGWIYYFSSCFLSELLGILDLLLLWWWPFDNPVIIFLVSRTHLSVILVKVFD